MIIIFYYFYKDTIEYVAPESKRYMLNQGKDELEELKKSAEKGDIYALAITAMCLMFHDVKAAELSDLVGGEKKIGECLQSV
jgi:hypothetical protein